MLGGYHSFGPGGFRDSPLADVLPINIGPAQRQSFGEPLREDVHLPGPVRMRPAAPLGLRHPMMQIGVRIDSQGRRRSSRQARLPTQIWTKLPPLDGANLIERRELKPQCAGAGRSG